MTDEDGIKLARHLRALAATGKLRVLSVVRDGNGDWQGNFANLDNSSSYNVDIRNDPVDALLVASGAVGTLEMNRLRGGNPLARHKVEPDHYAVELDDDMLLLL